MRILHLISSRGLFGAERVVIELSKGLKLLHNCRPIVGVINSTQNPHIEVAEEARNSGIDTVIFQSGGKFDLKTISSIRRLIKRDRIDLIHCHGYKSNLYGLLASSCKIPTVATNHNWLTPYMRLKIYCFLDSLWIRYFDRIVAVSEEIKEVMLKKRILQDKIRVIENGIDLCRFNNEISTENIKRELSLNGNIKVIGTIGYLRHEKGLDYLLKAAKGIIKINESVKFLIVGDGPLRKYLENETINLGIQNSVIFTGYRKDIPEVLSVMDVFVLPSIQEGLPMVLLEAMAVKKPVVASKVGDVPKVIQDNKNGILVEPRNVLELEYAITDLINDQLKARNLAHEGYAKVKRDFSSESMCRKYFNLYREITSE